MWKYLDSVFLSKIYLFKTFVITHAIKKKKISGFKMCKTMKAVFRTSYKQKLFYIIKNNLLPTIETLFTNLSNPIKHSSRKYLLCKIINILLV